SIPIQDEWGSSSPLPWCPSPACAFDCDRPILPVDELLFNRLDHEVHNRDVVRNAVCLQATVKLLRDAGRQLRDGFVGLYHAGFMPLSSSIPLDAQDRADACDGCRSSPSKPESSPRPSYALPSR